MPFHRRADGFYGDVIESSEIVAAGWIPLCRVPVPPGARLEIFDCLEEFARCRHIADILEHIRLRADEFICLCEVGASAVTDNLLRDVSGERVAGHTRKRIRTAALQRDFEIF